MIIKMGGEMKSLFKLVALGWLISPFLFVALRLSEKVNIYGQNSTVFLVLCGFSFVALFFLATEEK